MAGNTQTTPFGVQDSLGVRASGRVANNGRVQGTADFVGTAVDQLLFSGTSQQGAWTVPDQRVRANGIPTISQSSAGVTSNPSGTVGPMFTVQPDSRIRSF